MAWCLSKTPTYFACLDTFTAAKIQVEVFWVVTPCSDVVGYQSFGVLCCLHLHIMRRHIPEDLDLRNPLYLQRERARLKSGCSAQKKIKMSRIFRIFNHRLQLTIATHCPTSSTKKNACSFIGRSMWAASSALKVGCTCGMQVGRRAVCFTGSQSVKITGPKTLSILCHMHRQSWKFHCVKIQTKVKLS
jgi:hypothetical protein